MRSRFEGLSFRCTAAMMSGLLALSTVAPAFAQGKQKQPGAAAAAGAAAGGKATAAPGKGAAKDRKLTDKQKKDEAKKKYKEGGELLQKEDFAGALAAYQEADDLVPGAAPKHKIAVCLDKMNKVQEAIDAYQKFLDANPDADKFKDQITDSKARIDALKKSPAKVKVATDPAAPPGLKISVDGQAKTGTEFTVEPGHHMITASADNFDTAAQEFDVKFAESKDLQMKLTAATKPPPAAVVAPPPPPAVAAKPAEPTPPSEPRSNVPAYVTLGLAVVGAGVGTVFGIQALGSKSDYNKAPTRDGLDKVERQSLLADMSYAVALTFGVTGVVLLLSNDEPAPKQGMKNKPATAAIKKTVVAPYVTPTGGGAAALVRF
jgi:tetratricopeptide (TPR) repeat protein